MFISIVIPVYNAEATLQASLESAILQSYGHKEIIVVDNNSTDNSWEIIQSYVQKYPDLISAYRQEKQGANPARNMGWKQSKGEWIQFLDADDFLKTDKISHQLALIKPQTAFVVGSYEYVFLDKTSIEVVAQEMNPWLAFCRLGLGITSANLYNRTEIERIGGWDETLQSSQEYDLMLRLLKINPIIQYDDQVKTKVQRVLGSISLQANQGDNYKRALEIQLTCHHYLKEHQEKLYDKFEDLLKASLLKHITDYAYYDIDSAYTYFKKHISQKIKIYPPEFSRIQSLLFNNLGFYTGIKWFNVYLRIKRSLGLTEDINK